jgi:hypothetical protein
MRKRKSFFRSDTSKKGGKLGRNMSDRREEEVRRPGMPWQIMGIIRPLPCNLLAPRELYSTHIYSSSEIRKIVAGKKASSSMIAFHP